MEAPKSKKLIGSDIGETVSERNGGFTRLNNGLNLPLSPKLTVSSICYANSSTRRVDIFIKLQRNFDK